MCKEIRVLTWLIHQFFLLYIYIYRERERETHTHTHTHTHIETESMVKGLMVFSIYALAKEIYKSGPY